MRVQSAGSAIHGLRQQAVVFRRSFLTRHTKATLIAGSTDGSLFTNVISPAAALCTVRGFHASRSCWGVEEFWKGSLTDPEVTGGEKTTLAESGHAWPACLLRLKNFEDLHKLWYVCLKEKNYLMSERHASRQFQVQWRKHGRLKKVKLTMKRILTVLSRREIHEQALRAKEILEQQKRRESMETQRFLFLLAILLSKRYVGDRCWWLWIRQSSLNFFFKI